MFGSIASASAQLKMRRATGYGSQASPRSGGHASAQLSCSARAAKVHGPGAALGSPCARTASATSSVWYCRS